MKILRHVKSKDFIAHTQGGKKNSEDAQTVYSLDKDFKSAVLNVF